MPKNDPIDEAVGKVLTVLADPSDKQARTTANINRKVPVSCGLLLAFEKRINQLQGNCENIDRPLYPPSTFLSDTITEYLHLTPSVASRRADKILEAFGESKALGRVPDMRKHLPFDGVQSDFTPPED